jgi:hypothetical protein
MHRGMQLKRRQEFGVSLQSADSFEALMTKLERTQ